MTLAEAEPYLTAADRLALRSLLAKAERARNLRDADTVKRLGRILAGEKRPARDRHAAGE